MMCILSLLITCTATVCPRRRCLCTSRRGSGFEGFDSAAQQRLVGCEAAATTRAPTSLQGVLGRRRTMQPNTGFIAVVVVIVLLVDLHHVVIVIAVVVVIVITRTFAHKTSRTNLCSTLRWRKGAGSSTQSSRQHPAVAQRRPEDCRRKNQR